MIHLLDLLKIAACYGEVRVCKNKWSQLSSLSAPAWFANTSQSCPATDSVQTTKVSCWDSRASHTSQWLSGRIRDQTTRDLQHSSAKKLSPRLCHRSNSLQSPECAPNQSLFFIIYEASQHSISEFRNLSRHKNHR